MINDIDKSKRGNPIHGNLDADLSSRILGAHHRAVEPELVDGPLT